jgi:hypothetical protein
MSFLSVHVSLSYFFYIAITVSVCIVGIFFQDKCSVFASAIFPTVCLACRPETEQRPMLWRPIQKKPCALSFSLLYQANALPMLLSAMGHHCGRSKVSSCRRHECRVSLVASCGRSERTTVLRKSNCKLYTLRVLTCVSLVASCGRSELCYCVSQVANCALRLIFIDCH